ncbi:Rieske (2Fe-2S) protein [Aquiflexum sp. TKW24L]|uniref:QcrA and Rieske domain-containing protein n=1 Tax=Aquiflexum sp. TKW24L TaxID=2942212 RepID=UPI0020C0606F|nr:Rieske (2Fe-2S) protein [Aquiflexum sp. TKW24L]MCL6258860.1 Rieske (2Fe-2S) protein [Aquiflexum sp. TKW24L]
MKTLTEIKTGELSTARRDFIKKSGALAAMSLFGVAFFTSCSSDDPAPGPTNPPATGNGITVTSSTVTVNLDLATALATAGGWALVIEAKVLIVNLGNNAFSALTSVCTHSQCDRNWTFGSNIFTCTCHGSRFNTEGVVLNGPAIQPLRSYATSLNNRTLTVNLT